MVIILMHPADDVGMNGNETPSRPFNERWSVRVGVSP